ncbi:transposase [Leifsonia sp. 2TAF2]|uniref:transposase n=1 Tax=Leifsonia sp. 2TAF2 TaxID=3233009 RepID=UPI003F997D47
MQHAVAVGQHDPSFVCGREACARLDEDIHRVDHVELRPEGAGQEHENCRQVDIVINGTARRLAISVQALTAQLEDNQAALAGHVQELAPGLQKLLGVGAVTGAILVAAYSHQGRVRNEAAFAALAGASPLQASSGNTTRHRLNRHGDRQLNRALDVIARVRLSCDPTTRDYLERRLAEGKTKREIRRSLKRYIARQLFRHLSAVMS